MTVSGDVVPVLVEPKELRLQQDSAGVWTGSVRVTNPYLHELSFAVKTNVPEWVSVSPRTGSVPSLSSVTLQAKCSQMVEDGAAKLLVEAKNDMLHKSGQTVVPVMTVPVAESAAPTAKPPGDLGPAKRWAIALASVAVLSSGLLSSPFLSVWIAFLIGAFAAIVNQP